MYRVSPFVRHFARALLSGALVATLWVNLSPETYYDAIEFRLTDLPGLILPRPMALTPLALVTEGLMALFLAFIGKELWEALTLPHGALAGRRAALPALAIAGGLAGSVVAWLLAAALLPEVPAGAWAIPIGSDVVLAYALGRLVFGPGHPALHVLLAVTIGLEMAGLLAMGLSRPPEVFRPLWLILPLAAPLAARAFVYRDRQRSEVARAHVLQLWPWAVAGLLSWIGVLAAGLPGALGLLPVIPAMPHARRNFGLFAEAEGFLHDPLNRLAQLLVRPVAVTLFLFGLTCGGVVLSAAGTPTLAILAAIWAGKPLGLLAAVWAGARFAHLPMPPGLRPGDWPVLAALAALSFTVPLLAIGELMPGGLPDAAARLGLAIGLFAAAAALPLRRATAP
ncbi:Na+/H+ antiporter NhaA [Neotabrizicola shimadae]|uniref:Putative Na(+)/H(+) antiporter NhaA homolog n=1 Tax=Neotabrizicola shimadae TaxID=2807096 RepID=A0A8G0ZSN5_9RHOB|nr:Na+/H+ antiporter NhaA [Neotabrizicola shimadae]QYZ70696.1 Na+/H+ antiporter NhaA [Neotabrizicola shimadae]